MQNLNVKKNWKPKYSQQIQSRYNDGIWHIKIGHVNNNEKRKTTNEKRNDTIKSRKISSLREMETYKYLGKLEVDTIKQVEMKEKF